MLWSSKVLDIEPHLQESNPRGVRAPCTLQPTSHLPPPALQLPQQRPHPACRFWQANVPRLDQVTLEPAALRPTHPCAGPAQASSPEALNPDPSTLHPRPATRVQDLHKSFRGQPGSARGSGSSRSDGSHFAAEGTPQYPYSPMAWVAPAPFAPMQVAARVTCRSACCPL